MESKKIVLAGGTGFVGEYLTEKFQGRGYTVYNISRQEGNISWKDNEGIVKALNNAEMLINLAGKSVNCRYTDKNKAEILRSRTVTTQILGEAILKCENPPAIWMNSSTATIYRHAEDRPMTESTGEIGTGFSVGIAKSWEKVFFDFNLPKTRQVALRMTIVLGANGGVMPPILNLVKFGLGGKQGKGNQKFSWIHIDDLYEIINFIQLNREMKGVYNCAAPIPVDNQTLMKALRRQMKMPLGLPTPTLLLTFGAWLIGTETELILKSRWVIPEKLEQAGFKFKYNTLEAALAEILG